MLVWNCQYNIVLLIDHSDLVLSIIIVSEIDGSDLAKFETVAHQSGCLAIILVQYAIANAKVLLALPDQID